MRSVGRETRSVAKAKGKATKGKGEHGRKGSAGCKGTQQVENLVMDEVQDNMRVMKSEKEKDHREDVRMRKVQDEEEKVRGVDDSREAKFERSCDNWRKKRRTQEEAAEKEWTDGSDDEEGQEETTQKSEQRKVREEERSDRRARKERRESE